MKLLMISGDRALAEGKRGAFYNTLEEFHKYWDQIDIICPKAKITNYQLPITNFGNVYFHPSPWPLIFQPLWILREGHRILKANGYKPEDKNYLMTVHEYPPFYNGIGARLLWRKTKIPYILEIFHIPGHPRPANQKEFFYKQLVKIFASYDASEAIVVRVMNRQVWKFLKEVGVPAEKLLLIPAIYVDMDIFKPMDLPKEYDFIFIGRLEKNKGIDLFLETVKKLDCHAIIVGDGSLKDDIKLKIKNYKLEIDLYGWAKDQTEIAGLLNKSKILVMTSYNEGGPRVVVEAIACGIPVLATPVGVVPDLLKNGTGGEIIEWEVKDITEKAREILNNYETYINSGIKIATRFEKKEAIKNYAEKLKSIVK